MRYYDGMGKDVSDYVAGLEAKIQELEGQLKHSTVSLPNLDIVGKVEETEKPKIARRTKSANTK